MVLRESKEMVYTQRASGVYSVPMEQNLLAHCRHIENVLSIYYLKPMPTVYYLSIYYLKLQIVLKRMCTAD